MLRIIAGSLIALVGVGYVALEFVPHVELPYNMRLEEAGGPFGNEYESTETV